MVALEKVLPAGRQADGEPLHRGQADEALLKALIEPSCRIHRQRDCGSHPGRLGCLAREVRQGVSARISARPERDGGCAAEGGRIMGKPTGFLEFERLSEAYEPVEKRLKNYQEFVHP